MAQTTRRMFLSASAAATAAVTATGVSLVGMPAMADTAGANGAHRVPGRPINPQHPDGELRDLLRELDERRIEATVRTLAYFGTRHTLSTQDDPNRGIGAARD